MFNYNKFRYLSWAFGLVGILYVVRNGDFDSAFLCVIMQLICGLCEYKWPVLAIDPIGNPRDKK